MDSPDYSPAELRRLSAEELTRLGEDSLKAHLLHQAIWAHQKHGPLNSANLNSVLNDPDCLRYPTRLVFEVGEMAVHQFAQPDIDYRAAETDGRVLYLHPNLRELPGAITLAIAYMIPVINYGEIIQDGHCLAYGATLLGLLENEFYERICQMADSIGSEVRRQRPTSSCHASACAA